VKRTLLTSIKGEREIYLFSRLDADARVDFHGLDVKRRDKYRAAENRFLIKEDRTESW